MFRLDDRIAAFSDGTTLVIVVAVAVALGLRHATDPDHVAAVTTLIASGRERSARLAARLGLTWGLGHATTLFAFGLPVVLYNAYLPEAAQRAAETSIGFVIVALAVWLLVRWRRGAFHAHEHGHGDSRHTHVHAHPHAHARARGPLQAYGIGLVHGLGGTAGVGVLLLSTIDSRRLAVLALALFALCTAVSMALLSTCWGVALGSRPARRSLARLAPALGTASLVFGVWYALGAQGFLPYYL